MFTGSHRRKFSILTVKKIVIETYRRQKIFVCNSLVSIFFYSADLRTRLARSANFPSRKKSITLLTCCINNYFYQIDFQ
jgi:hypothetical protein